VTSQVEFGLHCDFFICHLAVDVLCYVCYIYVYVDLLELINILQCIFFNCICICICNNRRVIMMMMHLGVAVHNVICSLVVCKLF